MSSAPKDVASAGLFGSAAFRVGLLTLLAIELMVLVFYTTSLTLVGRFTFTTVLTSGVLMVAGDLLIELPLFVLLVASERWRRPVRWTLLPLVALPVAIAQSMWDTEARTLAGMSFASTFYEATVRSVPVNFYALMMWVGMIAMQAAYLSLRERSEELVSVRAAERAAQLSVLRFQLNPHFLFNALNALSSLVVVGRAAQAEEMIGRLSGFLRTTLDAPATGMVRLEDEFGTVEAYLDVERVRFDDRLDVRIDLPAGLRSAQIPPFLLQPLVENAIKYGVAPAGRLVTVEVSARTEGGELIILVADDGEGAGAVDHGAGVGLVNVRERLALSFGADARLETGPAPGGGYRALVRLPAAQSLVQPSSGAAA